MDSPSLLNAALTVVAGALAGGLTNGIAIWMLFRPHEPRKFGPFRLVGAVPKNKPRLARSIGRTVGERLLTPADLAERLSTPELRAAFDAAMHRIITPLLEEERGPLGEAIPAAHRAAVDEAIDGAARAAAREVAAWAAGPGFAEAVAGGLGALRAELGDRPVGDLLTEARRARVTDVIDGWLARLAEGDDLDAALRHFVTARLDAFSTDHEPLLERLPPGLVAAVEVGIGDYLPVAIERLGRVLADPEARDQIHAALRDAYDRAVRDLLLHERLVARLVVNDKTLHRLLEGFERDGFERFAAAVASPEMRERLARAINDAVVAFLRVPLAERIERLGPERRAGLERTLGDWLVRVAREPATRAAIAGLANRAMQKAEARTWGELLALLPDESVAPLAARALDSERGRALVEQGTRQVAQALLARPIGRPASWLGPDAADRLRAGLTEAAWSWVQAQIPLVVGQIRVPEMVEEKVLGFSTQRMEEIVRGVTQRELDLIIRLGYVLGAFVGLIAASLDFLLP